MVPAYRVKMYIIKFLLSYASTTYFLFLFRVPRTKAEDTNQGEGEKYVLCSSLYDLHLAPYIN